MISLIEKDEIFWSFGGENCCLHITHSQFNHHTWSYMNSRWPEPSWFSSVWGPMHDTLTTVWNLCSIAPWSGQTNKIKAIVRSCLCHGSLKPVVAWCSAVKLSSCGFIMWYYHLHQKNVPCNTCWYQGSESIMRGGIGYTCTWVSSLNILVVWDTKW